METAFEIITTLWCIAGAVSITVPFTILLVGALKKLLK